METILFWTVVGLLPSLAAMLWFMWNSGASEHTNR